MLISTDERPTSDRGARRARSRRSADQCDDTCYSISKDVHAGDRMLWGASQGSWRASTLQSQGAGAFVRSCSQ